MLSPRHADALVSGTTFAKDLSEYRGEIELKQIRLLKQHCTTFSLQFDGWSTRSQKYSFSCLTATWIDSVEYKAHHTVLDMSTITGRKSASALTGWVIGVLHRLGIFSLWSGHLTTDSESTNIKVHAWLPGRIQEHVDQHSASGQDRLLRSPSWTEHPWKWSEFSTLCFAHHIHLIVTAGYEELGAHLPGLQTTKIVEESSTSSSPSAAVDANATSIAATAAAAAVDAAGNVVNSDGDSLGDIAADAERSAQILLSGSILSLLAPSHPARTELEEDQTDAFQLYYEDSATPLPDQLQHATQRGNPTRRQDSDIGPKIISRPEDSPDSELAPSTTTYSALVRLSGLCAFILNSSGRREMFIKIRKTVQPGMDRSMPIKYVSTRWNSRYDQQRRALLLRPSLDQFVSACPDQQTKRKVQQYALTDEEWRGIKQFNETLAYFAVVNRKFQAQGPESVLNADVLEIHCRLKRAIEVKQQQLHDVAVSRALARMADELRFWRKLALASDTLVLAALLDPRHDRRQRGFEGAYPEDVERAIGILIQHAERVGEDADGVIGTNTPGPSIPPLTTTRRLEPPPPVDILDEFRSIRASAFPAETVPESKRLRVEREVRSYLDETRYTDDDDHLARLPHELILHILTYVHTDMLYPPASLAFALLPAARTTPASGPSGPPQSDGYVRS
ncbi:unnamed protein product [Tilletia controversa]|nr:unnamed protein product [Tilletia controversa]